MDEKITIKDVARLSGLSKGTVDRVIHNRGEVSQKSYDKVMQVIKELGYEPNVYASLLASRKQHVIAVLIPQFQPGEYWELAAHGSEKAKTYAKPFNIAVESVYYDQYNIDSFRQACNELLAMSPSGVVLAPMFKNETSLFTQTLRAREIPYAYIDTKLEDSGYFAYFGMPMYQSGYLCADLLSTTGDDVRSVAVVRIERDKNRQSDPTVNRRAGFLDYMSEHYPDREIYNVFINPNEPDKIDSVLDGFFKEHQDVSHVVMFNSRVHLITDYIERSGLIEKGIRLFGYDNLAANIAALKRGTVKYLITQHTLEQSNLAVQSLVDHIALKKAPDRRDNYMHMDILTKYNAEYY
jgi:Transcriptional regulators